MPRLTCSPGKGYHPFQILFARMSITVVCASLYMWYKEIEHFPWGMREVRPLLVARGLSGFFGVFGMYCRYSKHMMGSICRYSNVLEASIAGLLV